MAIANSDGSIILSTKVDTSGLNKGMSQMQGKATSLAKTFSKLGAAIASAFAIQKIIQFSNEAGQLATQTEASVQRLVDIYGSASDSVGDFIDANARALGMSKAAAASFSSVYGNLFSVWADQATNAELTNRYLNMTAVVASKTGRTVEDVQERVRSGLLGNTEAIEDLGIFVNVKTIEMTDAFQRMANGKSWEQLDAYTQQQIRSMAILEQATAKYGSQVAKTSATTRARYQAAYEDFQNSWGNIVNTVLLPVLETLTQIFDIATKGLNALSGRSGQILENVELQEENTDKTAENIEEQTENQKDLNKEMNKTLAGFDDIQILSSKTAKNTEGQLKNEIDGELQGAGIAPSGTFNGSEYVDEIDKTLAEIMEIVSISLIAIGLILAFTGNVAWGIGYIIGGAATYKVTEAAVGRNEFNAVSETLTNLMLAVEAALIAIGVFLIIKGKVRLGIGFIAKGAIGIGITEATIGNFDQKGITEWLGEIEAIAGGALLALGVIMLQFKFNIPLAISLIAGGAVLLVDNIADIVEGGVAPEIANWINAIMVVLEGALLVIGIVLLFSKVNIPLGISLVATGALALGKEVAVNWDAIVEAVRGPIGAIMALISASLLVVGILVCAVNPPLGISLMAAGAAGLATVTALNWDTIVNWVSGAWNAVKTYWRQNIAKVFTAAWWKDLGAGMCNGLIWAFESGINGIVWLFESMINLIVDGVNKLSFDVPEWLGGGHFGFDLGKVSFGRMSIPRLAQGAVIPPNREFLAVLGDNKKENEIVSPVSAMKQAFMDAMIEMGGASQTNKEEHYYLNETELMSVIYRLVKGGERLNGESLVVGGQE